MEIAIKKYGSHPAIIEITDKNVKTCWPYIWLDFTSYEQTAKEVNNLNIKKVSIKTGVPIKFLFPV